MTFLVRYDDMKDDVLKVPIKLLDYANTSTKNIMLCRIKGTTIYLNYIMLIMRLGSITGEDWIKYIEDCGVKQGWTIQFIVSKDYVLISQFDPDGNWNDGYVSTKHSSSGQVIALRSYDVTGLNKKPTHLYLSGLPYGSVDDVEIPDLHVSSEEANKLRQKFSYKLVKSMNLKDVKTENDDLLENDVNIPSKGVDENVTIYNSKKRSVHARCSTSKYVKKIKFLLQLHKNSCTNDARVGDLKKSMSYSSGSSKLFKDEKVTVVVIRQD
ncbi:hypothetical protein Tco_1302332, partial [Tanacetum coccineum]